ncbi:Fic family protein [Myroides pelagicus]|uniref:Cell filamentation protein Fic n=1 Tax=Myroides pelagicus TaxID=270914 RepID=A0A7K1GND3_9FLAO|nr:Fic family protein [Myroides pelagicus]MEC4114870.1 Fic family protein [Myroides pelagicus]MTH30361.1 cell filamentation protein Fic [Myroides pelagicus]
MKLEKPPKCELNFDYLQGIWRGEFKDFIIKSDEKYYYWDDIKYKKDVPFGSQIDNWILLKTYRTSKYQEITFGTYSFRYFQSEYISKNLHDFDLKLIGGLQQNSILPSDRIEFFKNSLLEEAVASSQVEGAATTTEVARDMLKTGRIPRNESEQMIFNNLRAIEYISEFSDNNIDFKLIIDLQKIITANTDAEKYSGDFRDGEVYVTDHVDGEIAHIPPDWKEITELMGELCEFINDEKTFIHPIIKASIIHFMIGFIHPFKDGNGRTARALFYWYLLKKGYSLVRNISISRVILESRSQYDKAFLKTEYDQNDLNYFITYSIKNIRIAFEKLTQYRDKKLEERKKANLVSYELLSKGLNKRQADLVGFLYLKEKNNITLSSYAEKHEVVRQTASKDLSELIKLGLLVEDKSTKPFKYTLQSRKAISDFIK